MRKFKAFIRLTRPINFIITFFTSIVAVLICTLNGFNFNISILAGLSAAFTASAGNIINDIFDIEIDKINRPKRPLASKKISKNSAIFFYLALIITSLILSWFINFYAFIIVLITTLLLFIYSKYLKRIVLIGNIIVSLLTGLVFIFGGVVAGNPSAAIIPAVFAFSINLIREIVKDMQDVEGDKVASITTYPIKFGFQKSKILILVLTVSLIIFTLYPFITQIYKIEYFIVVMAIVNPLLVYGLKILFKDNSVVTLIKISKLLKLNMVFGLIAILLG